MNRLNLPLPHGETQILAHMITYNRDGGDGRRAARPRDPLPGVPAPHRGLAAPVRGLDARVSRASLSIRFPPHAYMRFLMSYRAASHSTPGGWLIPIALMFVLSFPPVSMSLCSVLYERKWFAHLTSSSDPCSSSGTRSSPCSAATSGACGSGSGSSRRGPSLGSSGATCKYAIPAFFSSSSDSRHCH